MKSPFVPSLAAIILLLTLAACSGTSNSAAAPDSITLSLTPAFINITADGAVGSVVASAARSTGNTNPIALAVTGVPAGVTVNITQPGAGSFGTLLLASSSAVTPGTYAINVAASDGTTTSNSVLTTTLDAVDSLTVIAANPTLIARQDATPVSDAVTIARSFGNSGSVTLSATGLPSGLTASFTQPGAGASGAVTFATSTVPALPGTYTVTINATDGKATASTTVSITIAVVLTVNNTSDTTIGIAGHLQQFMSTGFQPSTYNNNFFTNFPSTTDLTGLNSEHLRLQPVVGAIPQLANSTPQLATDWSFTGLDNTVQPVLNIDDQSPIFQIAKAPGFLDDANGHFIYNATNLALLTTYAQNLVRYYNTGGFTWGSQHFQSASTHHITWWAIFNEPNLNNVTAVQYVSMYNTLVPAMLAIDPTLKFIALELSDFTGQPQAYLPTLVGPTSTGLNAQVNAFATHFYGTCKQTDTDSFLFNGISQFVSDIGYFRSELATRSDLANTPVWVTENNVNSDYPLTNGYSSCTPTIQYVLDPRGTSTFFTAYRPLLFSRLGKAGSQALYHFLYEGSQAYGEVNSGSAAKTLAYWTDYWLERTFPWNGSTTGSLLLKTTTTESTPTVDIIATLNADNSVSLMVTNFATASATDNNGSGAPRTIYVNFAGFSTFSSATEVDLNASTPMTTGPTARAFVPGTTLALTPAGYGSSMFILKP